MTAGFVGSDKEGGDKWGAGRRAEKRRGKTSRMSWRGKKENHVGKPWGGQRKKTQDFLDKDSDRKKGSGRELQTGRGESCPGRKVAVEGDRGLTNASNQKVGKRNWKVLESWGRDGGRVGG